MSTDAVRTASAGPTGFHATGWTVSRGTEPEEFDVQVLGVLNDGVAAGVDMIMVEASGPAVDKAGGIWAGMSGSPVYSDDGKFIGAVAYGLAFGPSKIGGLAAADDMVDVLDGNVPPAANSRKLPADLRKEMVATGAVTARQAASGPERLRTPLAVSGLGAGRLKAFTDRLAGHDRFIPFVAGAAAAIPPAADPAEIVPGGNFAAALSYGELTAAGVGTTTLVCDGKAVAFGHPFNFDGPTALSVHTADAILIQDDPLGAPFKLANIVGTVADTKLDQDRLSGIRAVFGHGAPDPVVVSSKVNQPLIAPFAHVTNVNRTREVPDIAAFHLISNIDGEIDRISGGRSTVGWTVTGTAGGKQFSLTRNNKFADPFDISFSTPDELFFMLATISENPFVDVTFDQVKIDGSVQFPFREYRITGVEQRVGGDWEPIEGSITAEPGATLRVRVLLAQDRSMTPIAPVEFNLKVPAAASGEGSLDIFGGSGGGGGEEGVAVTESGEPETFDELLDMLRKTPQNNQIVATLSFFGGGDGGEGGGDTSAPAPVTQTKDAAEVVTGGTSISVSIPGDEPPCGEIEPCEEPGSGPTLNLGGKSAAKLSTALKRGLKLTLRTSEAGRATVKALVDRKTARRLKIKKNAKGPVVVAAATKRVHSGRNTVKLVFTKKARKRLKHAKRVKLGIRATIRSVEGNTATDRFNLTLKRKLR
ncbi:MAG TPA: SpoIVB peptidase S55 domain-containing protein [Solirubrobacteraceae bacterium]|nr:SpoIVB peptidase S55 domain-containing protein [Solirubrobacteraceae bacterium]